MIPSSSSQTLPISGVDTFSSVSLAVYPQQKWYMVALLVGGVVVGGIGCLSLIGIAHMYGTLTLPHWLAHTIEVLGNTPGHCGLWVIAVAGVGGGIALAGFSLYKIRQTSIQKVVAASTQRIQVLEAENQQFAATTRGLEQQLSVLNSKNIQLALSIQQYEETNRSHQQIHTKELSNQKNETAKWQELLRKQKIESQKREIQLNQQIEQLQIENTKLFQEKSEEEKRCRSIMNANEKYRNKITALQEKYQQLQLQYEELQTENKQPEAELEREIDSHTYAGNLKEANELLEKAKK